MGRTLLPTRLAEQASRDRGELDALLDEVLVAHVGLTLAEGPLVLPIGFARDGDRLLFHGSTGSRWLRALAAGVDACVSVTALDGVKVARSAFESGMRYRSACLFGRCTALPHRRRPRRWSCSRTGCSRDVPARCVRARRGSWRPRWCWRSRSPSGH